MLKIPFRKQRYYYDCGATALEMVLLYLDKKISYKRILNATCPEKHGTPNAKLIEAARQFGLRVSEHRKSSWQEMINLVDKKKAVIVNYTEPETNWGHFAVVTRYDSDFLYLNDPEHGPNFKIAKREFLKRWHGSVAVRWLITLCLKNKDHLLGF